MWLTVAISAAESLLIFKLREGQFPHFHGHPTTVVWSWGIGLCAFCLFTILYFYVFKVHLRSAPSESSPEPSENESEEEMTDTSKLVDGSASTTARSVGRKRAGSVATGANKVKTS